MHTIFAISYKHSHSTALLFWHNFLLPASPKTNLRYVYIFLQSFYASHSFHSVIQLYSHSQHLIVNYGPFSADSNTHIFLIILTKLITNWLLTKNTDTKISSLWTRLFGLYVTPVQVLRFILSDPLLMYLSASQAHLDGISERKVSTWMSQLLPGWLMMRLKLCPTGDSRKEWSISSWVSLGIKSSNYFLPSSVIQTGDCTREIVIALSITAHQAHFPHVVPTSKHMISLWTSGMSKKEIFPNDLLIPRDQVGSQVSGFYDSYSWAHRLSRGLTLPIPDFMFSSKSD